MISLTDLGHQEETTGDQRKPTELSLRPDDTGYISGYFKPLGFNKDEKGVQAFYFFVNGSNTIIRLTSSQFSKLNLVMLAPFNFLATAFEKDKGGWDNVQAADFLCRLCNLRGIFQEDMIRGRGAWIENDKVVIHTGKTLIIDGQESGLGERATKYIYELGKDLDIDVSNPLTGKESEVLIDVLTAMNWQGSHDGELLAGWLAIAPLCGVLPWRPHIWITGGTGTGKSWTFDNIIRKMISNISISVQGNSTEAGVRQKLRLDALNVIFDEAEAENEQAHARMQNVMGLMRAASASQGAEVLKGSATGQSKSFMIRSCFAFASIVPQMAHGSDFRRITLFELQKLKSQAAFKELDKLRIENIDEDFAKRFQARMILNMPNILKSIDICTNAVALEAKNRALGDQLGGMLAGYWHITNDSVISFEDAETLAEAAVADHVSKGTGQQESDEQRCLQHLLSAEVKIDGDYFGTLTVGELVECCVSMDGALTYKEANKRLRRLGIMVDTDKTGDDWLFLLNTSSWIKERLKKTAWASSHRTVLGRLEGAQAYKKNKYYSAGVQGAGLQLLLKNIIE